MFMFKLHTFNIYYKNFNERKTMWAVTHNDKIIEVYDTKLDALILKERLKKIVKEPDLLKIKNIDVSEDKKLFNFYNIKKSFNS